MADITSIEQKISELISLLKDPDDKRFIQDTAIECYVNDLAENRKSDESSVAKKAIQKAEALLSAKKAK